MKRFRLERLARLRALEEREARQAWGAAERAAREAEERAQDVREALAGGRRALAAELASGALDPRGVLAEHRLLGVLGKRLTERRHEAATRAGQAGRMADAWRERHARSEALARLRTRARAAERREQERREALLQDERALARSRGREPAGAPDAPAPEPIQGTSP